MDEMDIYKQEMDKQVMDRWSGDGQMDRRWIDKQEMDR